MWPTSVIPWARHAASPVSSAPAACAGLRPPHDRETFRRHVWAAYHVSGDPRSDRRDRFRHQTCGVLPGVEGMYSAPAARTTTGSRPCPNPRQQVPPPCHRPWNDRKSTGQSRTSTKCRVAESGREKADPRGHTRRPLPWRGLRRIQLLQQNHPGKAVVRDRLRRRLIRRPTPRSPPPAARPGSRHATPPPPRGRAAVVTGSPTLALAALPHRLRPGVQLHCHRDRVRRHDRLRKRRHRVVVRPGQPLPTWSA